MKRRTLLSMAPLLSPLGLAACSGQDEAQPAASQSAGQSPAAKTFFPDPYGRHRATWLQWPHDRQYGVEFRDELDPIWTAMASAFTAHGERLSILVYDAAEEERVRSLLADAGVNPDAGAKSEADAKGPQVEFLQHPFEDVWVRDNGPIFVKDDQGGLHIQGWGFNGWGKKEPFAESQRIPRFVAGKRGLPFVDLSGDLVLEGGSWELSPEGVLLATRSAVLNDNRNPGRSQAEVEQILRDRLGAQRFVWLDGVAGQEITDMHIDGLAVFGPDKRLITMDSEDLDRWGVPGQDIEALDALTKDAGLHRVDLPLTQADVVTTSGKNLEYPGSYVNFYAGNSVVLVPQYRDPSDAEACEILRGVFPGREIVGIDIRDLYASGGMIHCVTQPEPAV